MTLKYQDDPIQYPGPEESLKYRRQQKMIICCSLCNEESVKYRINIKNPIICHRCALKLSFKGKDWEERNNKSKKTKMDRYGDPSYTNPSKISKSLKNRSPEQKQVTKEKVTNTNLKRYGGHPASRESQKERTKQTCLGKYGEISPMLNPDIKRKQTEVIISKYGVDNAFKSDYIKEKIKQTCLEKYGVDNPRKNHDIDTKIKQTCLEKYGVDHPWKDHDVRVKCQQRYLYNNIYFDSSWELYMYIYLIDHNIKFQYQPNISFEYMDGKKYFPDFEIDDVYYELKGDQFFENGKLINPYDRSMDYIYEAKYQCMIKNGIVILRRDDLNKVFDYVNSKYTEDFVKLFKTDIPFPFPQKINRDNDTIIKYFHKSIYYAHRKGFISPFQAWDDKEMVKKSAINRLKYVGKCSPSDIIYGFNTSKIAPKVSVLSYKTAKHIVDKYMDDCYDIIDPFSGFSARMMAVCDSGKKYSGCDILPIHINESNGIKNHMNYSNCELKVEDINNHNNNDPNYDCLFTCPPYNDKEIWGDDVQNLSCDDWISLCMSKYKCNKYIFIVDHTDKYKDNIKEELVNKSHLNTNKEYIVII